MSTPSPTPAPNSPSSASAPKASETAKSGVETAVKPTRAAKSKPSKPLPPWKVLLHNDDINDARYVVRTVMNLVHVNFPTATDIMITAHTRGVATITLTHKERAELYRDQFRAKGLTATIEQAGE